MSVYLTVHFLAVLAYSFPTNIFGKLKYYAFPYVYPYFHQSWSLFVPVPKENFYVYVKQDSGDWEDLFGTVIFKHQKNRLGGNETLMLALSNSLRYYASSVKENKCIEIGDDSNINFIVLKKIISSYYENNKGKKIKDMQVIIRITGTKKNLDYAYYYKIKE